MARGRKTGGRRKGTPKSGGRKAGTPNKVTAAVKQIAQPYTAEAVGVLVSIMRNTTLPPQARVAASKEILDRGHGKPPQAIMDANGAPMTIPAAITFLVTKASGADCLSYDGGMKP